MESLQYMTLPIWYASVCVLFILVYPMQDSFEHTQQWLQKMDKYASPSAAKLLVGNKSELTDKRVVDFATGKVSSIYNHI